ncbi:MAG: alpha/beta hydrolase [Bdellovibrionota bacterium]
MRWIFLRGLIREKRHWGNFPEVFAKSFSIPSEQILSLDLPGIGTERGRIFPSSMTALVEDVRARSGIIPGEKIGIFSMSLGSMCALGWASSYPDEIGGVVLVNTSAADLSSWNQRLTWVALKAFGQVLQVADPFEREKVILKLGSNMKGDDAEIARYWASFAPKKAELLPLAAKQLWVAARFRAPAQLKVPCLILSSTGDRLANPSCSALLAKRYGVENHVHLKAGHDLGLDDPEWVIQRTSEWKGRYLRHS